MTKKKAEKRHNVRKVAKDPFQYMERIWAENGVVNIETKTGELRTMTVRDAASRAMVLNQMPVPAWERGKLNDLITKIKDVCMEAQAQRETPKDKKTEIVQNILEGKNTEGKIPVESNSQLVDRFMFQYPSLTKREVEVIAYNDHLPLSKKEEIVKEIHRQNLQSIATREL